MNKKQQKIKLILADSLRVKLLELLRGYNGSWETEEELEDFRIEVRNMILQVIPKEWQRIFQQIKEHRISPSYILLRNLPVDDISAIPTPTDGFLSRLKKTKIAEAVQMAICELIGIPYAFKNERRGAGLIHLIAGRKGQETALTSENSKIALGWHCEHAFSPISVLRPSYVTLLCLRPDPEKVATTGMVDIRDLIQVLSKSAITLLREPIYSFRTPDSFGSGNGVSSPTPIIGNSLDDPEFNFSLDSKILVVDGDPCKVASAYAALTELIEKMDLPELQHQVRLDSGDLLLMNNVVTAHCRTKFLVHDHGMNRWCQRIIVRPSLFEARSFKTDLALQFA